MIESLKIQGYQTHINTYIEFDKGMNVVRGENASGKSAMVRAIRWVKDNKPTGDRFINWAFDDATPAIVELGINGHVVARRRSRDGKINEYQIDDQDVLTGFGVKVPDPIRELFNLDDTNMQAQHSPLFMLTDSPQEMARRLNKLTNLESIDIAYTSIRKKKNEATKVMRELDDRKKELEVEVAKYTFLPDAKIAVEKLILADSTASTSKALVEALQAVQKELSSTFLALRPACSVSSPDVGTVAVRGYTSRSNLEGIDSTITSLSQISGKILKSCDVNMSDVEASIKEADSVNSRYLDINELYTQLVNMPAQRSIPDISGNVASVDNLKLVSSVRSEINSMLESLKGAKLQWIDQQETYDDAFEEYEKTKPSTCPVCGGPWNEEEL